MTDTIGWGEVDKPSRRPSWWRLNRRRRIAMVVAGALVAGGVVAWPSFTSWRADAAARHLQHIWARAQGYDNARVVTLAAVQSRLSILDRATFASAVAEIATEEAADLDRLIRQAKSLRTWASDVAAARTAVVTAMTAQAAALRTQASQPGLIGVDFPLTTAIDPVSSSATVRAIARIDELRKPHDLRAFVPTTERYHSATNTLAALRRPTDQPLHLRLVTSGTSGLTVTDLDSGQVVRRPLDTPDSLAWQAERMFGRSVVGSVNGDTLIVPLDPSQPERRIADAFVASSTGTPMWLLSLGAPTFEAVDESGRVGARVAIPDGVQPTGLGTGSVMLTTDPTESMFGSVTPSAFYLGAPGGAHRTRLAVSGCPQLPALDGGLVAIPTGNLCDYATEVQIFDLTGRLVRTDRIPAGDVTITPAMCAPDGKHLALVTGPKGADAPDPRTLRVLDTATGSWTTVDTPGGWLPLGWSSDGTALLLQAIDSARFNPNQQFGSLAYLRVGDPTLHSIRVAANQTNFLV